jgi:hypothetical protein
VLQPYLLLSDVPNLYTTHNPDYAAATTEQDRDWKHLKAVQLEATCSCACAKYAIRLPKPWRMVSIEKWSHPIPDTLCQLVTGSEFIATRLVYENRPVLNPVECTYIVDGWIWDGGSKKDYRIYYHACSEVEHDHEICNLDDSGISYAFSKNIETDFRFAVVANILGELVAEAAMSG